METKHYLPEAEVIGKTQEQVVFAHLNNGWTLTSYDAQMQYGIARLASRICELRDKGVNIAKRWVKVPTRYYDRFADVVEYYLIREQ